MSYDFVIGILFVSAFVEWQKKNEEGALADFVNDIQSRMTLENPTVSDWAKALSDVAGVENLKKH